jgi:hypothetical protein
MTGVFQAVVRPLIPTVFLREITPGQAVGQFTIVALLVAAATPSLLIAYFSITNVPSLTAAF